MNVKNFHWQISETLNVNINNEELWKIISSPSNLELFHPFCNKNPIINWPGKTSIDEIYYYSGLIYQRKFIKWTEGVGYDLLIGEKDGPQSLVSWKIQNNKQTSLTITIYPYKYNTGIKLIEFIPYTILVKPLLKKYIESVMLGLEYFIKNNKRVQKNQFGYLPFFSNK